MSPFEDEVQPAFDPRLIDAPPQAIADTRVGPPPSSAPPVMPPVSAAMPTQQGSGGPRKPFLMPPPGQPKIEAELPPTPVIQPPVPQQPPQARGMMPPPPITPDVELPAMEVKQPGAVGVPTGADARDVMGDRPSSPADLALKRETQAGMDKLAARPAAPKENWGTRLATAILAMTKFAPATDLIVHPKWSSQERQYNREVETAGERIKLAQEAQKAEDVDLDRQLKAENIESMIANRQNLRDQAQQKRDDAIAARNQTDAVDRDKMGQIVANPEHLRFESAPVVSGSLKPQQYGPPAPPVPGVAGLPLVSELATSGPSKSVVTTIRPGGSNQVASTAYDPEGSQRFQKTPGQLAKEKWEATTKETPADILEAYPDSASRMTEDAVLGYRNAIQRGDQAAANALAAKERAKEANATQLAIAEMANATRLAARAPKDNSALVQSILRNPLIYDSLTPTARTAVSAELEAAGFEFGKPLSDTAVGKISESKSAVASLKDLRKVLSDNEQYIGPIAGLQALNPYSDARKAQADIDRVKQRVGKALEGGVLRKEDEDKYKRILATLNDEPTTAVYKVDQLIEDVSRDMEIYQQEMKGAGRRVAAPAPQAGGTVQPIPLKDGTVLRPHSAADAEKFKEEHRELLK